MQTLLNILYKVDNKDYKYNLSENTIRDIIKKHREAKKELTLF